MTEKGEVKEWMRRAAKRIDEAVLRFETREQEADPISFVAQIIAGHCPVEPTTPPAHSVYVTTPIRPCKHERLDEEGYCRMCGADMRSGVDLGAGPVEQTASAKLRKRAAYLRKCFQDNPATLACMADELDRQAQEIAAGGDGDRHLTAAIESRLAALAEWGFTGAGDEVDYADGWGVAKLKAYGWYSALVWMRGCLGEEGSCR
jgi:hypothetical protein